MSDIPIAEPPRPTEPIEEPPARSEVESYERDDGARMVQHAPFRYVNEKHLRDTQA